MSIPSATPAAPPPPVQAAPAPDRPLTLANGRPVRNDYEAYWAMQPPEVQALMNLRTVDQRMALARELASQGFIIDVPIMVWNWDPLATMIVRRNQGFTWVPSALQEPVQVAPGLSFPGLPSYNAANPPPGSILVSTDFAKGFEHTNPWLRTDDNAAM